MQSPRMTLAECEFEMLQYRNEARLLLQVMLEAAPLEPEEWLEVAGLRLTVTVIDLFPPDVAQWRNRSAW